MKKLVELQEEIYRLQERNAKVEADKAWETSISRRIIILILTYFSIVVFFIFAGLPNPFANAIVPSLAFLLSTLTLPFVKRIWLNYIYKR
ncbi:MAG: hypothetical protein ABIJ34_06370 [archaeon]